MTYSNSPHVAIVGGRIAGSALAIQLGNAGINVTLIERSQDFSPPPVSSPIIYSPTMKLLDELGISETEYARNTPRIYHSSAEVEGTEKIYHPIPGKYGRNYAYAIERVRFDRAIWEQANNTPNVKCLVGTSVMDLLWDSDRVIGVIAKDHSTQEKTPIYADITIGADGRHSTVSRKANAQVKREDEQFETGVFYCHWHGGKRSEQTGFPSIDVFRSNNSYGLLLLDTADDMRTVIVEGHADHFVNDPQLTYLSILKNHPSIWNQLEDARQSGPVKGIRKGRNIYREPGGEGWALVGDAYHHKDPFDGQGIYNALFCAKSLSEAILGHIAGAAWDDALSEYEEKMRDETLPMFRTTMQRIGREIYRPVPSWMLSTVMKWILSDRDYLERWNRLLIRDIHPDDWFSISVIMRAIFKGAISDMNQFMRTSFSSRKKRGMESRGL